jgi:hypothetical protein
MSSGLFRSVSSIVSTAAVGGLLLSACVGGPRSGPTAEFSVAGGTGLQSDLQLTPAELAARPEPRSVTEAAAIEAELAQLAKQRAGGVSASEIAALEARARELRRLAAAGHDATLRR